MPPTPVPLRQVLCVDDLSGSEVDPQPVALGSFWAETNTDIRSRIVKYFKHPDPPYDQNSAAHALTEAYAELISERLKEWKPDWIVRVLAGRETKPDPEVPLSILSRSIAGRLKVPVVEPFYRTDYRKSMRNNPRLSGPDALRPRISYVVQDLCILPEPVPGKVALLDDIYNLGASARVYSRALTQFCMSESVLPANLAATRFNGGKDGWGYLVLDLERLLNAMRLYLPETEHYLADMVVVNDGVIHTAKCPKAGNNEALPRFLVEQNAGGRCDCLRGENGPWWKRIFSTNKRRTV